MRKAGIILFILVFILVGLLVNFLILAPKNKALVLPSPQNSLKAGTQGKDPKKEELTIVTQNLEIPWSLAFLPDQSLLFTERPGRVGLIDKEGNLTFVANILEVKHRGEGGLLGITLHPDFRDNKYVYLYYTYANTGDNTLNRVVRYKLENKQLRGEEVIVNAIPGAINHNGGRIKFGPDKFLYITTGDALNPSLAQDKNSLAGKILRVTDEGKLLENNPFGNLVYSYGHRNPQGLAWDNQGRLWATEHGPQAHDELNLIERGANYGWPIVVGDEEENGMRKPILESGSLTWAPSGAAFIDDSVFFAGLRGSALFEAELDNQRRLKKHLEGQFGRLRDVVLGTDGLYIATNNRDGRGEPREGDDKIIKINLQGT